MNPRTAFMLAINVILQQFSKMFFILWRCIVETCWEVVCIYNRNLPSGISDIDASINWDRNFRALFRHPFTNLVAIRLQFLGQIVNETHPITSSNSEAASPLFLILPPSKMCMASKRPRPTAMSGCLSNAFSMFGWRAAIS